MQKKISFKTFKASLLFPLALLYSVLIFWRNFFYKHNFFVTRKLPRPVISIGNLTVGGTGKTPIVMYICEFLKKRGYKTSIISRGYQRNTKGTFLVSNGDHPLSTWEETGDEPYMMAKKLCKIPIVVDEDRYRGGMFLINNFNPDIIVIDDGFQHRSLYRDVDIVLINGNDEIHEHKVLPYGLLREPWHSIKRADAIFITKNKPQPFLNRKIKKTSLPIFYTKIKSSIKPKINIKNKKVFLFCGIADPETFKQIVVNYDCNICGTKIFPDHFNYPRKEIIHIEKKAKELGVDYILTTEKDWTKIENFDLTFSFIVLELRLEVIEKDRLKKLLNPILI